MMPVLKECPHFRFFSDERVGQTVKKIFGVDIPVHPDVKK
ncbi:hypothetical protein SNSL317_A3403 [Salmonella enterica subsp. enterica serovar Newport str. SL317]|nr:hypothetical protein SNSL317_A3403 [Salmonella enterica subsp. enterica serovar Newport str. SL317]EDZ31562.1 hypothetical protein SeW_A2462 [Salmonella enterica subsp. enterica serovar Weltevreden str. HI_N05-537]